MNVKSQDTVNENAEIAPTEKKWSDSMRYEGFAHLISLYSASWWPTIKVFIVKEQVIHLCSLP